MKKVKSFKTTNGKLQIVLEGGVIVVSDVYRFKALANWLYDPEPVPGNLTLRQILTQLGAVEESE